MTNELQPLDEYNESRAQAWEANDKQWRPIPAACPECGTQVFENAHHVLMTMPPKRRACCPNPDCDWKGTVVA